MKKYIKIESQGIIDSRAFTLIGASTKRGDSSKIGFFGSGLKYSLAFLLRNDIDFKVFADYQEIIFSKTKQSFRDKFFDVINVNGKPSDLTTEMGMDWKHWFIVREIYCNAIDEGQSNISVVNEKEVVPVEDKTVFYICIDEGFAEILQNWDSYFNENRKDLLFVDKDGSKIYNGGSHFITYRKGIRILDYTETLCLFNYDLPDLQINESRMVMSEFDMKWNIKCVLQKTTDKTVISHVLNMVNECYEKQFSWDTTTIFYSKEWIDCVAGRTLVPFESSGFWHDIIKERPLNYLILPSTLVIGLKSQFNEDIKVIGDFDGVNSNGLFKVVETLNKRQQFLLDSSFAFLSKCNIECNYPVKIVDFFTKRTLGQAKDGTVLLSIKLFDLGKKEIVSCILEEIAHLDTGLTDETREFQNYWISKYVSTLEELSGNFL